MVKVESQVMFDYMFFLSPIPSLSDTMVFYMYVNCR